MSATAAATPVTTRQWILTKYPSGKPILDGPEATFKLVTTELPPLKEDQVLCRIRYLSNDPGQRVFINPNAASDHMYVPRVDEGSPMRAGVIAEVVESRAPSLAPGQLVMNLHLGLWSEYMILDARDCQKVASVPGLSVTHFVGALGAQGLAAYYGTKVVAAAQPEDTLVVSSAGGATGSMVVQIAKRMIGCRRVIGICGSDDKCEWVRECLGADACLNYRSPTFERDLARATPDHVDVYFDCVGGEILDAMLTRMNRGGRVALCGTTAMALEPDEPLQLRNWRYVMTSRVRLTGIIVLDYIAHIPEAIGAIVAAAQEGKIVLDDGNETIVEAGIEDVPRTWMRLFSEGGARGKLVTKLR